MNHPNRGRDVSGVFPEAMLRAFSQVWPEWFSYAAERRMRGLAGEDAALWRSVYVPGDVAAGYFEPRGGNLQTAVTGQALAAWRLGRGLYRFDPEFAAALIDTRLEGGLPAALLAQLPEWAVWVDTVGIIPGFVGFFAVLDGAPRVGVYCVRFTLWTDDGLDTASFTIAMEHDGMTLEQSWAEHGGPAEGPGEFAPAFRAAINLVLYLCDVRADYYGALRPKNPVAVKTRRGWRIFPPSEPRIWRIGERIGERLRQAQLQADSSEKADAMMRRPHLRRAHWHTFRVGAGRVGYRVRWMHPVVVGVPRQEDDEMTSEEFREARLSLGLSLIEFARALGLDKKTCRRIDNGEIQPHRYHAVAVRMLLELERQRKK